MTSQHDKPKRWQSGMKWLFFVTIAVVSGAWAWSLFYRVAPYEPISWWDAKRPLSEEVLNACLIGTAVLGILIVCDWLAKRWRPRFSVRTIAIVVTLACCYAACWGPTKEYGPEAVREYLNFTHIFNSGMWEKEIPVAPLVVAVEKPRLDRTQQHVLNHRRYYFWFFGFVVKLPFERTGQVPVIPLGTPPPTRLRQALEMDGTF